MAVLLDYFGDVGKLVCVAVDVLLKEGIGLHGVDVWTRELLQHGTEGRVRKWWVVGVLRGR